MKVFNFFIQIFAIFSFLTIGSLLLIVGTHILAPDAALMKLHAIYASPAKSLQILFMGIIFITVGLAFTKMLLKKGKVDAIIIQSEIGPLVISLHAIEDVTRKVIKRFHLCKEWKIASHIQGKDISIKLRLVLWSGGQVQDLLTQIQDEIRARIRKLVGVESKIEVTCDVHRIEDHEADFTVLEEEKVFG